MEDLFRSADWTTKRGILRELARSWDKTLNRASGLGIVSSAFIFTGTGLSRELISDVISSVVVKTQFLTSVYDTGAFDDPETQAAYLERFFPSVIWKNSGLLGDRIYYWLRGRHRFTAEYMSLVLQCGYQNMHQLLDQYIRSLACFQPADCASPEKNFFGIVTLPGPAFGFENLNARMREKVKTIAHEYLFTSKLETRLGSDERAYIELGLARISGYDGKISIKIDESLVLLSCAVWFNEQRAHTVYKTLADRIDTHNPFTGRNGFEEFISYYLLQVFQNPIKLKEVFDFESREHNGLGDREAQLVTLHLDGNQRLMEGKVSLERGDSTLFGPIGLGIGTRDHSLLNEWLSLRRRETFCFPMNFMGPDIMCFLKLEGEGGDFSYICLAIQCKFRRSESLEPKTLRGAIATVTPRGFFQGDSSSDRVTRRENVLNTLQNHSHRCLSAGEYGIIRIICGFPVEVRLDKAFPQAQATPTIDSAKRQRITTQDPDEGDNHPLGKLRTSLLISTTENEHPKDILGVIMQCADDARNKGLGYWDENDPAVLTINRRCEGASSNGTAIDEFAPSSLRAGSKRKYN
ncbi:hypothetical protein C8R41DRAFT_981272 [Lentinula lateritia]|uniref:Uncharacterized protein n=1 Tax=Lentinula lateritia TaxID=40482 RepID=A0ABQ8VFB2_9AGAR|nr:hypothetical protein C8R41DRAFT_981272 [Lentinula lateritia]